MSGISKIHTTADSALVSFIESMTTPALTPSSAEQLKNFMSSEDGLLKENQELKSKVLGSSTKILERVITCLPDHTVVHRQLKSKLEEIVNELSDIKVFALQDNSKYGILTQFRMGAINLPNKFILFNLKYPTLDDSRNKPFYFHEVLESLGYEDRYYQSTGTLWTLYLNCETLEILRTTSSKEQNSSKIKLVQQAVAEIIQSEAVVTKVNSLLNTTLRYDEKLISQNDQVFDSIIMSDSGGTTGIGSAGDPMSAYFMASLYFEALSSTGDLKIWDKLLGLRVEAFPGAAFFWNCLAKKDIKSKLCLRPNDSENLDNTMRITNHLLMAHQTIKDLSEESYSYFYKYFFIYLINNKKNEKVKGDLILLDAQLLNWYYTNFKIHQSHATPVELALEQIVKVVNKGH